MKYLECTCVYITNLSRRVKEYQIEDLFNKYGTIKDVVIVKDPFTKDSRGFAFLTYETSASARRAISDMSGFKINDRRIICEIAKRSKSRRSTPGVYLGPTSATSMRNKYEKYRNRSRSRSYDKRCHQKYNYHNNRSNSKCEKNREERSRSISRRR